MAIITGKQWAEQMTKPLQISRKHGIALGGVNIHSRAPSPALVDCHVHWTEALISVPVEVVGERVAGLNPCTRGERASVNTAPI
jgi:hypothetical protein